jgi:Rrf2 family protein
MRLPAKIEYAIKATVALARVYESQDPLKISKIASQQKISSKFLLQLMVRLKNAKIVSSIRGASGGYILQRAPQLITIKDVIVAVDGVLLGETHDDTRLNEVSRDALTLFWDEINQKIEKIVQDLTVADMLKKMAQTESFVYTI